MRSRIYIEVDGRMVPAWSPNTPGGYARTGHHTGELVTGQSGPMERQRQQQRELMKRLREQVPPLPPHRPTKSPRERKYPTDEERREARRAAWRESKRRAREELGRSVLGYLTAEVGVQS